MERINFFSNKLSFCSQRTLAQGVKNATKSSVPSRNTPSIGFSQIHPHSVQTSRVTQALKLLESQFNNASPARQPSHLAAPSTLPDHTALLPATRLSLGASDVLARVHACSPRRARFCTAPSLSLQTESIPTTWAQSAKRDSKRMHRRRRNEQTQAPKRGRNNKAQTQAAAREYSTSKHERLKQQGADKAHTARHRPAAARRGPVSVRLARPQLKWGATKINRGEESVHLLSYSASDDEIVLCVP